PLYEFDTLKNEAYQPNWLYDQSSETPHSYSKYKPHSPTNFLPVQHFRELLGSHRPRTTNPHGVGCWRGRHGDDDLSSITPGFEIADRVCGFAQRIRPVNDRCDPACLDLFQMDMKVIDTCLCELRLYRRDA